MTTNVCRNLKEEIERLNKLLERLEALQIVIEELSKDLQEEGFTHMSDVEVKNKINIVQGHLVEKLFKAYRSGCLIWVDNDA